MDLCLLPFVRSENKKGSIYKNNKLLESRCINVAQTNSLQIRNCN